MSKLWAVIKREYLERVRSKWFIIGSLLAPLIMAAFAILPGLFFAIKTGGPTRLAVADLTPDAKLYAPVRAALLRNPRDEEAAKPSDQAANLQSANQLEQAKKQEAGNVQFAVEQEAINGRDETALKRDLSARVAAGTLDGYIILRPDVLTATDDAGRIEYFGRNVNDVITRERLKSAVNKAVREQRLAAFGVDEKKVTAASQPVEVSAFPVNEKGEVGKEDSGEGFWAVFILGLLIYMTIIMYGNSVMAAVIEEKGTRISEILFSSVRSFTLMMGKLVGVSLVGLTQYAIWALMFVLFSVFGVSVLLSRGVDIKLPQTSLILFVYLALYFLIGYFLYASLYALIGAMVTTSQEGTMMSMPVTYTLVIGFMVSFSVIRNPDSSLAFWLSMIPLFSPIVMPLRVVSHQPPLWQMLLSLGIGFTVVVGVVWLAARVYRVGMLMYGKKASIPEVMRWIRQA